MIRGLRENHAVMLKPGDSVVWLHCSFELLRQGVQCATTIRRPCACKSPDSAGHDHKVIVNAESIGSQR